MLNSHDKVAAGNKQIPDACAISVILSTLSVGIPKYQHPERIKLLIPKGLTSEIIVVHYGYYNARNGNSMQEKSIESNNIEAKDIFSKLYNYCFMVCEGCGQTTVTIYTKYNQQRCKNDCPTWIKC